jgi:hypothetical protein
MVSAPILRSASCSRPSSSSSVRGPLSPSRPAARNSSRQAARRRASMPRSRLRPSSDSPRSSGRTASVFLPAHHRGLDRKSSPSLSFTVTSANVGSFYPVFKGCACDGLCDGARLLHFDSAPPQPGLRNPALGKTWCPLSQHEERGTRPFGLDNRTTGAHTGGHWRRGHRSRCSAGRIVPGLQRMREVWP